MSDCLGERTVVDRYSCAVHGEATREGISQAQVKPDLVLSNLSILAALLEQQTDEMNELGNNDNSAIQ